MGNESPSFSQCKALVLRQNGCSACIVAPKPLRAPGLGWDGGSGHRCTAITCTALSLSPISLKESPARSQLFLMEMWEVRAQLQTCHDDLAELIRPQNLRSTAVLLLPFIGGKSVVVFLPPSMPCNLKGIQTPPCLTQGLSPHSKGGLQTPFPSHTFLNLPALTAR